MGVHARDWVYVHDGCMCLMGCTRLMGVWAFDCVCVLDWASVSDWVYVAAGVCLMGGVRVAESLSHGIRHCPAYVEARSNPLVIRALGAGGNDLFLLHRVRWRWPMLRALRNFYIEVWALRFGGEGRRRTYRRELQDIAFRLWH